jgi:hypothetical protein
MQNVYRVEVTDTFGGEANYCWVKRYTIRARSMRGAISKVARATGYRFRLDAAYGDMARYNARSAAVCAFVEYAGE